MFYKVIKNIFIELCYFESLLQGSQLWLPQYLGYLLPLYFLIQPQIDITSTYFKDFEYLFQLYSSQFTSLLSNSGIHEYLILLLNLLFFLLLFVLVFLNWNNQLVFQRNISRGQTIYIQASYIFVYMTFYISKLLQQPLLCVVLTNIVISLKENSIGWLMSDLFFAIWMHAVIFTYNAFFECNLQVTISHVKKINRSTFDQISAIIIMMQTYIYVLIRQDALYFQSLIFLILSLIKYYEIYFFKVYSSQQQIKIILIIYSSGFVISLLNLLQVHQPLTQYLLMEPIVFYISIKQWDNYFSNLLLRPVTKLKNEELNLMLIVCFNESELKQNQKLAFNAVEFSMHRRHCIKKDSCAQKYFTNVPTLLNFIQDDILNEIQLRYLIEIKNKKNNKFFSEFYYLCHFISAYQILGSSQEVSNKLEQKYNFNIFDKIRWKSFKQIIKQNQYKAFAEKLQNESKDTIDLSGRINAFIKSESFNQQIKDDLVRIIENRILFLGNFLSLRGNQILSESIKQIDMLEKQEKILKDLYENFQSILIQIIGSKNRSILMFFYAEILNDWYKAYDQTTINPVDIQFSQNSQEINFNSNKMNYMTFLFNNRQLRMTSFSKQAPSLFGYTFSEFKKIDEPNILIPNGVREYHNELVEHFLDMGEGKYLRKKGFNIIKHSSGYIIAVQFFYDFYYDIDHHLRFISFFESMQYQQAILVIDKNQKIQGLNKELLKLLNYKVNFINNCDVEKLFYNLPSILFITEPLNQFQDRVFMNFPNEKRAKQMMNLAWQQKLNLLQHRSQLHCYEMQCDVICESNYTIIKVYRILDADNMKSYIRIDTSSQTIDFPPMIVNDEEMVILPYDESGVQSPRLFESNQIIQTTRNNINNPLIYETKKNNGDVEMDESEKVHNSEQLTMRMLGDVYHQEEDQISGVQNEAQSCASSMAGIRRSIYFKKYLLYNKLNNPKFLGRWINYIISLLVVSMLIQLTFLFIILSFTIQDYSKIEYYYQSIQINHYFIEPLQKFFLTRYTLQDYLILGYYGEMDQTEQTFLSSFTKPNLIQQFDNLKVNFQNHFGDPNLQTFFVDKYLSIKQQIKHTTPIKLQVYNMTLVNAFSILLEAFYSQYRIYVYPKSISGVSSYNTYQYVNYMLFVSVFDDISNEIYAESNNQIQYTINKWILLIIPIVIVNMFILSLFIVYSLKYQRQLENILKITRFCEDVSIQRDLKRLKFLIQNLKTNSELLHKYKFNLEAKEKFIVNEQYVEQKQEHFTRNEKGKPKDLLRLSKSILIVSFLFLTLQHFFITIFATKINLNYQQKFPQTIEIFKAISDLGVYVPAAYSQKEILYFWNYFSYYTEQDRLEFINQIEESIIEIQAYLALGQSNQEYQFSPEFLEFYQQQDKSNLCLLFDPKNYVNFEYFCENSKDGLLKLGLRATLTEFTNQLKNEKEMSFQNRTVIPRLEMEAVYFCSDAISILTQKMSEDIKVQSSTVKLNLIILFLLSTSFTLTLLCIIVDHYQKYIGQQLYKIKKLAYVLPQETIFTNDHFERDLRMISVKEQYI